MSLKEDEKEVLAHIVQNIDEQEIFLEFVAKAETIKEAWQIAKIFENKKREFEENLQEYDLLIKSKEKQLKSLTDEITEANALLKDTNMELEHTKTQLQEMQDKAQLYKNKILQNERLHAESFETQTKLMLAKDDNDSNLLDFSNIIAEFQPLNVVSVHVKNGATAMARVAQTIYPPELYEIYCKAGRRLFKLKDKIGELELKNEKLRVELRDLTEEDNFKEHMRSKMGDIHDEYVPIATPKIPEAKSLEKTKQNTNDFDTETPSDRLARIEKKKERVEEMLSQLSNVLREEGINEKYTDDFLQAFNARNRQ